MGKIGRPLAGFGLALGVPIAYATKQFANFDDAIRMVGAVTQATGADFAALERTALELGRTTSFTATEVAMLMTELGRAGFSPDQINKMTGAVLDLSKATGTDATLASGIMAATIRQFGLQASDAARVADTLTTAANKSFNSVEQLGEALGYAGPVAADFGMSIEDTLAILGSLGNVGIQGSEAGTALRRLLTLTGGDAQRLQQIFGVAFVDAAGNARPLVDVLSEVNAATQNLGTGDRAAKFSEAFGLLGITAASALGKAAGDTRDLRDALNDAAGTARKTAEEMDAGLGGTFRKIMSALEGVQIAFGKAIAPALQQLEGIITSALGDLTEWINANQRLVTFVAASVAAIAGLGVALIAGGKAFAIFGGVLGFVGPLLLGVGPIVKVVASLFSGVFRLVKPLLTTFRGLATLLPILFNPLGAGLVLLGAVAAAWFYFTDEGGQALSVLTSVFGELWSVANFAFGGILKALQSGDWKLAASILMAGIKTAFVTGLVSIINLWPTLTDAVQKGYANIGKYTGSLVDLVVGLFMNSGQMIADLWGLLPDFIRLPLEIAWTYVREIFTSGIGWLSNAWTEFSLGLVSIFDGFVVGFRQVWNGITQFIISTISRAVEFIRSALDAAADYDPTGAAAALRDSLGSVSGIAQIANEDIQRQSSQFAADKQRRDESRGERISRQRAESDRQVQEIADKRNELVDKLLKGLDVESVKQELADLVRKAGGPEKQAAAEEVKKAAQKPNLGGVPAAVNQLAQEAKSASVRGTFANGVAAFQQLAAGGVQDVQKKLLEKIAAATQQTAKNTEGIANSPGLAFQE